MHLERLNDAILAQPNCNLAKQAIEDYCEQHDLDADGYELIWCDRVKFVREAEAFPYIYQVGDVQDGYRITKVVHDGEYADYEVEDDEGNIVRRLRQML